MRISDLSSDVCSSDLARFASDRRCVEGSRARGRNAALKMPIRSAFPSYRLSPALLLFLLLLGTLWVAGGASHADVTGQVVTRTATWLILVLAILRSEEHTSELQSLMRISYAVFCLKKKKQTTSQTHISDIPTS